MVDFGQVRRSVGPTQTDSNIEWVEKYRLYLSVNSLASVEKYLVEIKVHLNLVYNMTIKKYMNKNSQKE